MLQLTTTSLLGSWTSACSLCVVNVAVMASGLTCLVNTSIMRTSRVALGRLVATFRSRFMASKVETILNSARLKANGSKVTRTKAVSLTVAVSSATTDRVRCRVVGRMACCLTVILG